MKKEKSELVKEFEDLFKVGKLEIEKEIKASKASLQRARELADKLGIPFQTSITFTNNEYFPQSFMDGKFNEDDVIKYLSDEEGIDGSEYDGPYVGWQTSFC